MKTFSYVMFDYLKIYHKSIFKNKVDTKNTQNVRYSPIVRMCDRQVDAQKWARKTMQIK